jgi:lysophospholipase L1-like esterase
MRVPDTDVNALMPLIREVAEEECAAFLDLLPTVAPEELTHLWGTPQHLHPSTYGNRLFAEAMFTELRALGAWDER